MNTLVYTVQIMNNKQKEDTATLEILQVIENHKDVTQRHLADSLGVALGLANSYLKRCVRKGLIKVKQAPANRYLYYVTPKGFAEKSRLTTEYLSNSFDFYRKASNSCSRIFNTCNEHDYKYVLLCGVSELAEIGFLRASEHTVNVVGFFDRDAVVKEFLGLPVWNSFDLLPDYDACVITKLNNPHILKVFLENRLEKEKILIPSILGIREK